MVAYVAGTTEMATRFNEKGEGLNWTYIKDGEGGKFRFQIPLRLQGRCFLVIKLQVFVKTPY